MVQKKLQSESQYNEYDLDKDGVVSDKELEVVTKMHEAEAAEEKADAQRRMAWISMAAMIIFTVIVMIPGFIPETRLKLLANLVKPVFLNAMPNPFSTASRNFLARSRASSLARDGGVSGVGSGVGSGAASSVA